MCNTCILILNTIQPNKIIIISYTDPKKYKYICNSNIHCSKLYQRDEIIKVYPVNNTSYYLWTNYQISLNSYDFITEIGKIGHLILPNKWFNIKTYENELIGDIIMIHTYIDN